jgi:signal transduction histidine kinase
VTPAPSGRAPLRRRIIAAGALLILAFTASSVYDVWRAYQESSLATARELTTLSRGLAEEASRTFQSIDVALREAAGWYERNGSTVSPEAARETPAAYAYGLPLVALVARDADGVLSYSWSSPAVAPTGMLRPAATPDDAARGREWIASRIDESGHLAVARVVSTAGGSRGTVSALVDLNKFHDFYSAIDSGAGNTILLLRQDGLLIARQPSAPGMVGKSFPELVAQRDASVALRRSDKPLVSPIDGARRFLASSSIGGYPFVLVVTREEGVALRAWRGQTLHVAIRTLGLAVVTALLIAALVWQLARLDAAEAEKQRLERQLRQSQKLEAVGTLAGGIAHDFNNILGAILGYSDLARRHVATDSVVSHYLDQILQAGARARGLVERILAFSRSGLGERVPVHVQSVVEEALELLNAALPPRVRLEKKLDAGDTAVIGDPTQLHQVTMNLCTNAVQAMEHGGSLTVALDRVAVTEPRVISHGSLLPRPYVRLCVNDTGPGIAPAVLDRMFDPFFTTKAVGAGTGLGLSLVHGIVTDFGGAIDVITAAGAGTTFTVWLPAAGETPRPLSETYRDLPHGRGQAVMIVDDEHPLVTLAEEMLAELGYEPAGFESGAAALEVFRADPRRFDLVLTDETMPAMSGVQLAHEIRCVRPDLPILLMSGYSAAQLTDRAHAAGVDEVLRKPLVCRDLAEALSRALRPRC